MEEKLKKIYDSFSNDEKYLARFALFTRAKVEKLSDEELQKLSEIAEKEKEEVEINDV